MKASKANPVGTMRLMFTKGACSHTLFHIMNNEFGNSSPAEERASDPLAGGIMQHGNQCGMIWGACMAAGLESWKRCNNPDEAIALSLYVSRKLMASFLARTAHVNCSEITKTDFQNKKSSLKYMLSGQFLKCIKLADRWAPEAIDATRKAFNKAPDFKGTKVMSCAVEAVRLMGASEKEASIVSGFAGGLALSGNACGALAATIFMDTLKASHKNTDKYALKNPEAQQRLNRFLNFTKGLYCCRDITGKRFDTQEIHTEFLRYGGCDMLMKEITT